MEKIVLLVVSGKISRSCYTGAENYASMQCSGSHCLLETSSCRDASNFELGGAVGAFLSEIQLEILCRDASSRALVH